LKDVGEDVDSGGDVGIEGLGIIDCVFALGVVKQQFSTLNLD